MNFRVELYIFINHFNSRCNCKLSIPHWFLFCPLSGNSCKKCTTSWSGTGHRSATTGLRRMASSWILPCSGIWRTSASWLMDSERPQSWRPSARSSPSSMNRWRPSTAKTTIRQSAAPLLWTIRRRIKETAHPALLPPPRNDSAVAWPQQFEFRKSWGHILLLDRMKPGVMEEVSETLKSRACNFFLFWRYV